MKVTQSCPTLCDPMDCRVHGILQARILDWVDFSLFRGSSQSRDRTQVSCPTGGFFISWATTEAQDYWSGWPLPSPADLSDPGTELGSPALQADSLLAELAGKPYLLTILEIFISRVFKRFIYIEIKCKLVASCIYCWTSAGNMDQSIRLEDTNWHLFFVFFYYLACGLGAITLPHEVENLGLSVSALTLETYYFM